MCRKRERDEIMRGKGSNIVWGRIRRMRHILAIPLSIFFHSKENYV